MTLSISRGFLLPFFLVLAVPTWAVATNASGVESAKAACPVCGMHFSSTARTSFFGTHDGQHVHLCSFSCAAKLSDRDSKATFTAVDFTSGKPVPAESAYFLIRSKKLLKELEFDMPPSVVAFSDEKAAKDKAKSLGDGEVLKGWEPLKKSLVP